jgi:hypothetical protein
MEFLFFPTKRYLACVSCNLLVANETELCGGLCSTCDNRERNKLQKNKDYEKEKINKLMNLIKSDRDILLAYLLNIHISKTSKCGHNPVNGLEHIIKNAKENLEIENDKI